VITFQADCALPKNRKFFWSISSKCEAYSTCWEMLLSTRE